MQKEIEEILSGILPADSPCDTLQNEAIPHCGGDRLPNDDIFMNIALEEARAAAEEDEVPIGACIVKDGIVIAKAHNGRERSKCATHHAEILAIEEACRQLGGWRLPGATLYVTLEPCAMCAGAIINSRIPRVVFAAADLRFGAFGSLIDLSSVPLNHKPRITGGFMADEARGILSEYFKKKRQK